MGEEPSREFHSASLTTHAWRTVKWSHSLDGKLTVYLYSVFITATNFLGGGEGGRDRGSLSGSSR